MGPIWTVSNIWKLLEYCIIWVKVLPNLQFRNKFCPSLIVFLSILQCCPPRLSHRLPITDEKEWSKQPVMQYKSPHPQKMPKGYKLPVFSTPFPSINCISCFFDISRQLLNPRIFNHSMMITVHTLHFIWYFERTPLIKFCKLYYKMSWNMSDMCRIGLLPNGHKKVFILCFQTWQSLKCICVLFVRWKLCKHLNRQCECKQ